MTLHQWAIIDPGESVVPFSKDEIKKNMDRKWTLAEKLVVIFGRAKQQISPVQEN